MDSVVCVFNVLSRDDGDDDDDDCSDVMWATFHHQQRSVSGDFCSLLSLSNLSSSTTAVPTIMSNYATQLPFSALRSG